MASFRTGRVVDVVASSADLAELKVDVDGATIEAVVFPHMCPLPSSGDRVVVNMTGIDLGLGTGGVGFVLWNLDADEDVVRGPGHIVKMRYTPWQTEVLSVEAPESPHHEVLRSKISIDGMPVVVAGLHSQVAAAAAGIKALRADAKVGYLMTDGACLPLAWSALVRRLKGLGWLDATCTSGHAFGGDLEAVNVFSGLAALRHVSGVDVAIVAMGPGVVGTSTRLGSSALEQGQVCDAVTALGGRAIACIRISFADERERHTGVSSHTIEALSLAARERATVVVPVLPDRLAVPVRAQLAEAGITDRHEVIEVDGGEGLRLMGRLGLRPSSMGRSFEETPELFAAASAAGAHAAASL